MANAFVDQVLLRGRAPWTLRFRHTDRECLRPAANAAPITYPKPDGVLTFDRLTSVSRTGVHTTRTNLATSSLRMIPSQRGSVSLNMRHPKLGSALQPYTEYTEASPDWKGPTHDGLRFKINASNCIHCKACDIMDPNITWTVPEGGQGPAYPNI